MATEILDIFDSAVKIGLGALISGVTTYAVTHKNHKNEKNKEFREKKIKTLEYAVENIEPYFHAFQVCLDLVDGVLRHNIPSGVMDDEFYDRVEFKGYDEKLISMRDRKNVAVSRLKLMGLNDLHEKLVEILLIEREFRNKIHIRKELPSNHQLNVYCDNYYTKRNEFYSILQDEFHKIYS